MVIHNTAMQNCKPPRGQNIALFIKVSEERPVLVGQIHYSELPLTALGEQMEPVIREI